MSFVKRFFALIFALIVAFSLTGCHFFGGNDSKPSSVTDLLGREISVKSGCERVVCIGASALRLYSYVGDMEKLVGVEAFEKGEKMPVRPYKCAYKSIIDSLDSIGAGGPNSSPDVEAILSAKPDVIFSLYNDVSVMDRLQNATGVPVICLSYGGSDPFSDNLKRSLSIIGKVCGREARAKEVISIIDGVKSDLYERTFAVAKKPSAYLGSNTYNGGHGTFCDTLYDFSLFNALGVNNVTKTIDKIVSPNPTLDYETLITLDPENVFIDIANVNSLKTEISSHGEVFSSLTAFCEGKVYQIMPFNQYYTNVEIALCDAYFIGKILYPESFSDVTPEEKFNEICSAMLGVTFDYYSWATALVGGGFGTVAL